MERRTFVQASLAGACAAVSGEALAVDGKPKGCDFFELRTYQIKAAKEAALDRYLQKAFIPAVKRLGSGPVGVFVEKGTDDGLKVYVIIVHPTGEAAATLASRLAADDEYQKAAKDFLAARADDPIYTRIESSLLAGIEGLPKLEKTDSSRPRLFNLRIYESHNERANLKKIEMFNKGELAIFKRVGLTPVLFGQALIGSAMPNLTYLLVFPDEAGRKASWDKFRVDADWLKIKAIPEYADKEIVSKITNIIMTPASYSEI